MNPVKISFCVTYYNQAEYVKQSLDSIFSINLPYKYEILVGDDGSDDKTVEIVNFYLKHYPDVVSLFVMPRDNTKKYNSISRASANRLNLVLHATGKYIVFLDGDDKYCNKDFIIEALSVLDNNDKAVAYAFNYNIINDKNDVIENNCVRSIKPGKINIKKFVRKRLYIHVGAIVSKNIFTQNDIKELKETEDFDDVLIALFIFKHGDVFFSNKTVYSYRYNSNGIWTASSNVEHYLANAMDYKIISNIVPEFKTELKHRYHFDIYNLFLHRKEIKTVLSEEKIIHIKKIIRKTNYKILQSIFNYDCLSIFNKILIKIRLFLRLY